MVDVVLRVPVGVATAAAPDGALAKTFRDMLDGTFAEVVAVGADSSPITLSGNVVVDTLGALDNAKETDPDAASATIPALVRGLLSVLSPTKYETVAASQTDQAMGATGAAGDYLAGVLIVPGTAAAGAVSIKDGAGSAITIFAGGGYFQTPIGKAVRVNGQAKRRARTKDGAVTAQEIAALLASSLSCSYCKAPFGEIRQPTIDHIKPLARGGHHSLNNLVVACRPCNSVKGTRDAAMFRHEAALAGS